MTTSFSYSISLDANSDLPDGTGEYSESDSVHLQTEYTANNLERPAVSHIQIQALPTPYMTPVAGRVYDINLESIELDFLRLIYLKATKPILLSYAVDLPTLDTTARELTKHFMLERGDEPNDIVFTPDVPFPKYFRIINPLEVNGGGTGNDIEDEAVVVKVLFLYQTPTT